MKRKITLLALVLVLAILATSILFACNDGVNGKYYKYEDGVKNENSWIELNGKKWTDDAGDKGKLEEKDGSLEFYDENGEWICSGKVSNGVLVLESLFGSSEYRKDGATGNVGDGSQVGNSEVDEKAKVVGIQGGSVDGLTILLEVAPEVMDVDLSGMLTVSKNSSWQLYADKMGQTLIPTKYATNLHNGDNFYYIVVNSEDGSVNRTYTLAIFKNYYTNIYLKANDTTVKTIENVLTHTTVELNPPSEMEGYYLTWSTTSYYVAESNKVIEASSTTPKTHTVTLNTEGGKLTGEATHTLTYDSEYTLPVPTRKGYTFMGWKCNGNMVTNPNGSSISNFRFDENVNYYADWSVNYYTLNVRSNDTSLGTVNEVSGEKAYGSNVTLKATPKEGYSFEGWYKDSVYGTKVSDNSTFTITMDDDSATYVANFTYYTVTTNTNLASAGTFTNYSSKKVSAGERVTLTATTNAGYTWLGWYDGATKVSEGTSLTYTFTMGEESKTYTAKWMSCPVNLEKNVTEAGNVSGVETTMLGAETTIVAETNVGYTWLGWYDGETKVSEGTSLTYTFTMGEESKTYTAKWACYTITTNTNNSSAGTYTILNNKKVTVGEEVTLTATTNTGYTWLGWYDGETKVSEGTSLTYTFTMGTESMTYTAKWYKINLSRNDTSAGTISTLNGKYVVGDEATITATTNNAGYTWLGWYDGETKVSEGTSLTYTFTMGEESKTYTAKWSKVEIEKNITEAGSIAMTKYDGSPTTAVVSFNLNGASGSIASQTVTATQGLTYPTIPTRSGYVFAGWYSNSACSGAPFDFSADVADDVTLYAKWISHSGYGVLKAGNNGSMTLISKSSSSYRYYAFVPLVSETITIYTTGSSDTYGYLYNSSKSQLTYDDDSGSNNNFSISYAVTAGTLYYIRPCAYGSSSVTATVYIDATTPSSGGAINNSYVVGDRAFLTATTNNGYTWLGWYDGETKVSEGTSLTYTFTMGTESKTYTAKWTYYTISTETNLSGAGTYTQHSDYKVTVGEEVTLTATTNTGYTWLGWYDGETKVSEGTSLTYTFTMGEESKTYTAKWKVSEEMTNFNFTSTTTTCTITGIKDKTVKELVVPNYVTSIGEDAFSNCPIEYASIPTLAIGSIPKSKLKEVVITSGVSIGDEAFYNCNSLSSVTIGNSVTSIGNYAFRYCDSLSSVTIGNSVTSIGNDAFYSCNSLSSVTIGNSVTSIGEDAFWACTSLSSVNYLGTIEEWCGITFGSSSANPLCYGAKLYLNGELVEDLVIPNTVTEIKDYAFRGCTSIKSVTISDSVTSIGSSAFYNCYKLVEIYNLSSLTIEKGSDLNGYVGYYALDVYTSLDTPSKLSTDSDGYIIYTDGEEKTLVGYVGSESELTLPSGITSIYEYAFYKDDTITSVTIGNSVTSIGNSAFYNCTSLSSVTIRDSVTSIGNSAFAYCDSLTSVTIGNSVTSIGSSAFYDCDSLTSVTIGNSVTSIGDMAFYDCDSLTSVTIGNSVTSIGSSAFRNCDSLTSVTIGNSVTSIGYQAFSNCNSALYTTENSLKYVKANGNPYYLLIGATDANLSTYNINAQTKHIGDVAFNGCQRLSSITIPDSVTRIGENAFYDCTSLSSVTIGNSVTSIGSSAFYNCDSLTRVTIGSSVTSIGSSAFYDCDSLTRVTIGNSVTSIGSSAFSSCESLSSVTIGNSVTIIGGYAFYNCTSLSSVNYLGTIEQWCGITFGITYYNSSANPLYYAKKLYLNGELVEDLVIPNTVTEIKDDAFKGCTSIKSVSIPDSVTSIGEAVFAYCDSLTSVTIGNSVTSIGSSAFSSCESLSSVTIGNSVTSIGGYAFLYCNSLSTVYYNGTEEEWSGISIGDYNYGLTGAKRYYYSETEPTTSGNYWHYVDGVPTRW